MKRVVYSAFVGGYDSIEQPIVVHPDYDYILFSNDLEEVNIGVWQIRKIPYFNKENTRIARWVKTHPHVLLSNYDFSVWIDSNVIIASGEAYTLFEELYNNGVLVSSFAHPERNCIYDECLGIAYWHRDLLANMLPEILFLKEMGYPRHNGLCETNCVYRNHQDPSIQHLCDEWWSMIEKFSKRDQLSFNYVAWKCNISINLLLGENSCARNHTYFKCISHVSWPPGQYVWDRFLREKAERQYSYFYSRLLLSRRGSFNEQIYVFLLRMIEGKNNAIIYVMDKMRLLVIIRKIRSFLR